jgi:arabinogalactan oligomer/maltooligosaccharide transport system substrate-binding protein
VKLKKVLAVALAATMTMTTLAACGNKADNTGDTGSTGNTTENTSTDAGTTTAEPEAVSLKVWTPEEDMELTQEMMTNFEAAHPEYKITWDLSVVGVDESAANLTTDAEAAADVFLVPSGSIPGLVEAGLLYPITANADEIKSMYGAGALEACTKDGLLYGLPSTPNSWFLFYNKSMYTEDDMKSLESMMAKDLGDGIYNFSCSIMNSWYIEAFYYAAGCTLFGENGDDPTDCTWNNANGVAATEYLIDLTSNPKYIEDEDGIAGSLFKEGKLGAFSTGTWANADNALSDALGDDLGAVALPTVTINGNTAHLSNFADYKCYAIKSNTQAPLAAQLFAEFLNNEENQLKRFEKNGQTPTVLSLVDDPSVSAEVGSAALLAQTQYATVQPSISAIDGYWTPAATLGTAIVNGECTKDKAQEYLDKVVSDITSSLTE